MSEGPSSPLTQLQAPDEMALIFSPVGLGGRMEPEGAARFQMETIAAATLVDAVPTETKENFERARKLHLYGVLEYEFFTAAPEYALLVLEAALRVRFISYYDHRIPVFRGEEPGTLPAEDFDVVREARRTRLRRADGSKADLPIHLKALLAWARYERLLPGRRSRIVDRALVELRNHSAHPTSRTIEAPPGSSRMLRTVVEYINRLWGERTPGGRHFPGPIARRPRVVGLAPDGSASRQFAPGQILEVPASGRDWNFAVFLAAEEEELTLPHQGLRLTHREGFQTTLYPCELLWEGGWQELVDRVEAGGFDPARDVVEHLDRLFWIRVAAGKVDPARSAENLLACSDPPEGRWYSLIADTPHEALHHVGEHEADLDPQSTPQAEACEECFVEVQGRFATTAEALGRIGRSPSHPAAHGLT
ncbi:MAG: hypothetical protein H0X42_07520 [Solirubrobacterales bacterium]|nr:hypothetical protein [Solirubrobacterales bacterium]